MKGQTYISEPFPHRWTPKTRVSDLSSADRPREKLLSKGEAALSDAELLAVLLGSGNKRLGVLDLSVQILESLSGKLANATAEALLRVKGVGKAKACQVVAAMELGRRHLSAQRTIIHDAQDALPYLMSIRRERQEHFVCLSLNGANEVLASRTVTVGLLDSNQVHPREVFADPITDRAASILCAHNHPSGTLEASPEDIAITRRLVNAGEVLGIRVLDHLIVTRDGFLSMKQAGFL
ncbi:DNA repair protein RadC [Candidatus Bipolaricaulota bacterium]|nr:DNA repair protein RadC [Candidatus Bipolaricaulota bacterium]TFH06403.1 MAG: JAB domain-containing protein [Candidatus Atribacteria bacterium]